MNCSECQRLLNAWIDDEVGPIASADVDEHLRTCASCAARAASLRSLGAAVKSASLYASAPAQLRPRVRAALRNELAQKRNGLLLRWSSIAAAILLAGFIGWQLPHGSASTPLAAELLSAHVRSLMADHLLDVPSSDRHTVKPWFAGKIAFSPDVRDCAADGFPLVGGRLEYIDNQPVAALVYRHDKHVINVFVWPIRGKEPQGAQSINGYCELTWQSDGLTYCAISDASDATLQTLRDRLTTHTTTTPP